MTPGDKDILKSTVGLVYAKLCAVSRVLKVRIVLESRVTEYHGGLGMVAQGKSASNNGPLRFPPQSQDLPQIMQKSDQVEPVFVCVGYQDTICCLKFTKEAGEIYIRV